uniref:Uncharacterized protein n=2 Tax=Panagrolaimus TaxID=55784 RepID=A0A914QNQ1_9BILA
MPENYFFFTTLVFIGIFLIGCECKSPWVLPGQVVDGPSADERAAFFNQLWKDMMKQTPPHQKKIRRPEIMPTIAKARRAPLEAFDEWEGMMESLDNLRKPRFGRR